MKYNEMVVGLFDFIRGSVNLDESPKIVPAEPPKPKEEPKPVPAPAPTKESKGDDSLKECPVCKTMTVQRNEDPQAPIIWSCKNCGRQVENGEVVADGVKDRKVEPAKEGKVRERKHLVKEGHTLQKGSEWYEVFIDRGEEGGTESVASSNTYKGALKIKADLERDFPGRKYGIDKWRMDDSGTTEPIDTWTPEQEKASEGKVVERLMGDEIILSASKDAKPDAVKKAIEAVKDFAEAYHVKIKATSTNSVTLSHEGMVDADITLNDLRQEAKRIAAKYGAVVDQVIEGKEAPSKEHDITKMDAEALIKTLYEEMRANKAFMDSMIKVNEVAPPGWEPVVKKMKKHKDIETPWALAWWMKGKGYKPAKEGKDPNVVGKGVDKMSAEELIQALYEDTAEEGKIPDVDKASPEKLIQDLYEQHPEQFNVVARSLTDQNIAKDLATKHKGQVVPDSVDNKKFMVITKIGTTEQMGAGPYNESKVNEALSDEAIENYAWDVAGELPQIKSTIFDDKFKAKKVAKFYGDKGVELSFDDALKIVQKVKTLGESKIGATGQAGTGAYNENVDMKEAVERRARGKVVFPADSPKVKDNADHFPVNNIGEAKNALVRAGQYKSLPEWYSGALTSLKNAVRRAVKSAYPSIEVTEKIQYEDDLEEKLELLDEAKGSLQEAISNIELAVEGTDQKDHTQAYLIDQIKVHMDSEQGLLSDDYNIDKLKEDLQAEFDEGRDTGTTHEAKKGHKKMHKKVKIKDGKIPDPAGTDAEKIKDMTEAECPCKGIDKGCPKCKGTGRIQDPYSGGMERDSS